MDAFSAICCMAAVAVVIGLSIYVINMQQRSRSVKMTDIRFSTSAGPADIVREISNRVGAGAAPSFRDKLWLASSSELGLIYRFGDHWTLNIDLQQEGKSTKGHAYLSAVNDTVNSAGMRALIGSEKIVHIYASLRAGIRALDSNANIHG